MSAQATKEISDWLEKLGMSEYAQRFAENDVDISAVRICDATFGNIYRWSGGALHLTASYNTPPKYAEFRRRSPVRLDEMSKPMRQMIESKLPIHVGDTFLEDRDNKITRASIELGGIRTVLNVPMVKGNELVGAFFLSRQEVRPFTDKQMELVKNFAAQAVIAIENTQLLKELRERTEEVETLNQQLEQRVADQIGEIERMGRLRRFLPPQVDRPDRRLWHRKAAGKPSA